MSIWYNELMDYKTASELLRELSLLWIWEAGNYNNKIPSNLLTRDLCYYDQACDYLRRFPKTGDLERVALAQMQMNYIDDIEGNNEMEKLFSIL